MRLKNYLRRIYQIFKHPTKTFEEISTDKLGRSLLYFLIIEIILSIILIIFGYFFIRIFISGFFENSYSLQWMTLPLLLVMIPLGGFIAILAFSLFIHIFVLVFGGKGRFSQTLKVAIYSSTPAILLFWLPPLFIVAVVYSTVLTCIGICILQKLTKIRAIFASIIPILLLILLSFVLRFILR